MKTLDRDRFYPLSPAEEAKLESQDREVEFMCPECDFHFITEVECRFLGADYDDSGEKYALWSPVHYFRCPRCFALLQTNPSGVDQEWYSPHNERKSDERVL